MFYPISITEQTRTISIRKMRSIKDILRDIFILPFKKLSRYFDSLFFESVNEIKTSRTQYIGLKNNVLQVVRPPKKKPKYIGISLVCIKE